ncbi:hypothetical protein BDV93DRAFT_561630 [Ceratobasidium sp. AG-I]|nr:hypothetical protein BDV93DRAFT_561630 [Ceratobasidium sp. AG-I]
MGQSTNGSVVCWTPSWLEKLTSEVERFRQTPEEVVFPWALWAERLKTKCWLYEEFADLEAVSVDDLTGVFALSRIPMSSADCWVTRGLQHIIPEDLD